MENKYSSYYSSYKIRKMFLDFFKSKNHIVQDSSSLIPNNDNSLLWINSGIAALKNEFSNTNNKKRITSCQKCVRVNDIENVGITSRHHTFFEMLGNFSVGEYFRKEAIEYAWEFLTSDEWLNIDASKLYVTVFPEDKETYEYWIKKLPSSHISYCKDNFWEIGEGPCGPCTEIFYDRGENFNYNTPIQELYVGGENDRYIEIWNIVFSQFFSRENVQRSEYKELPNKNIDTGMGLERIACILQNVEDNFSTDLFIPIIKQLEIISSKKYNKKNNEFYLSFRIISDHIRALVFMISDGVLPSNESRGYVIRKLLRRAVLEGKKLDINNPFLFNLVDIIVSEMKFYKNLIDKKKEIKGIIYEEEKKFNETLNNSILKFNSIIKNKKEKIITGKEAFILYDTYGLPIYVTEKLADSYNFKVDKIEFNKFLNQQKNRSRVDTINSKNLVFNENIIYTNLFSKCNLDNTKFIGYDKTYLNTINPNCIFDENNEYTNTINKINSKGIIIFNKTPFYAKSGGQDSDKGIIYTLKPEIKYEEYKEKLINLDSNNINKIFNIFENLIEVDNVINYNDIFIHFITIKKGELSKEIKYNLCVYKDIRFINSCGHTATHLLNLSLKEILSNDITQAGSNINSEKVTFDFTFNKNLTLIDIYKIEKRINQYILHNINVEYKYVNMEQANKLGVVGIFTKKYKKYKNLRVVEIGKSLEFCGGTHVLRTSEIGLVKIIKFKNISSGTKRIEFLVNKNANEFLINRSNLMDDINRKYNITKENYIINYIDNIKKDYINEKKKFEKLLESYLHCLFEESKIICNSLLNYTIIKLPSYIKINLIRKKIISMISQRNNLDLIFLYTQKEKISDILLFINKKDINIDHILEEYDAKIINNNIIRISIKKILFYDDINNIILKIKKGN